MSNEIWTQFMDMNSGGGQKEKWAYIYIQAPEDEAKVIFYNRFGHNPNRVTCTCCGEDYSTSEGSLDEVTAYARGCRSAYFDKDGNEVDWYKAPREERKNLTYRYLEEAGDAPFQRGHKTLDQYKALDSVLFIAADDIKPEWRTGEVPAQGYVWVD